MSGRNTPKQIKSGTAGSGKNKRVQKHPSGKAHPNKSVLSSPEKEHKSKSSWELYAVGVLLIFLMISMEWNTKLDVQLNFAIGAAVIFAVSLLKKSSRRNLFEKITPIFLILLLQCVLYFAGMFYGDYPQPAQQQFFMYLGGMFVFATAFMSFLHDEQGIEQALQFFAVLIAVMSLFSIELATSGYTFGFFNGLAHLFGAQLPTDYAAFETNTRIHTVLENANVFAPIAVIGYFCALYRYKKVGGRFRKNCFLFSIAVINGTTFVLCFSLGAILAVVPALIVYFVLSKKEDRAQQFSKILISILVSFVGAACVFVFRSVSIVPLILVLGFSIGSSVLFTSVTLKWFKWPALKNKKLLAVGISAVCVCLVVFAYFLQGPYSLSKGETFRRAVSLSPGKYTLQITSSSAEQSALSIDVSSMSYTQAALKENTHLNTAALHSGESMNFDVPDSSAVVFLDFTAEGACRLSEVTVSNPSDTTKVPLNYKLLPEFIVNRLQGIWVNDNAVQRIIFFRDGIKLGVTSPIIGLGGRANEIGMAGVSDYYYYTKHVHNEYIERFVEGGIVGLLLFAALISFLFRALRRAKKTSKNQPLIALFFCILVLIFAHALVEADFLYPAYVLLASMLFAAVAVLGKDSETAAFQWKRTFKISFAVLSAASCLLVFGRIIAVAETNSDSSVKALRSAVWLDPVNRYSYETSYLVRTEKVPDHSANAYLAAVESAGNRIKSTDNYNLAMYYLTSLSPDLDRGITQAERYIKEARVNPDAWDAIYALYDSALGMQDSNKSLPAKVDASVLRLSKYLGELNAVLPKQIQPKMAEYTYLYAKTLEAQDEPQDTLLDSRLACDLNKDGNSDILDATQDQTTLQWKLNVLFNQNNQYGIKVYQKDGAKCEIALNGKTVSCSFNPASGCFEATVSGGDGPQLLTVLTDKNPDAYFTIEAKKTKITATLRSTH